VTTLQTWASWVGAGLVLLFVAGLVGWLWGREALKADIAAAPGDTVHAVDTVITHIPEIHYVHLPGTITTVHDTVFAEHDVTIASLDTVMAVHQDTIKIDYFFPPENFFNISFKPGPVPVLVHTETVTKTVIETEIDVPWVIGAAAVGITAGILIEQKIK